MCETLANLRLAMEAFAVRFDAHTLTVTAASRVLAEVTALKHMAAAVEALAAARVAEGGAWKREGCRGPAEDIARRTGVSVGAAAEALKTAERIEELPAVGEAARRGALSPEQTAAVASAAALAPDEEHRLLGEAERLPLKELVAECGRTRAAHTDAEAQRRRAHERRHVRKWQDPEGMGHLRAQGPADAIEAVWGRICAEQEAVFAAARVEGRREPTEAYAFDALERLVCGAAASAGTAAKVIARVDLGPLMGAAPADGDLCDIGGVAVAPSVIEGLLATGSAFLAAVVTNAEQVMGVAHLGRRPTAKQETALQFLYPTCAAESCGQSVRLQRDHRKDWARTKVTLLDLLDLLCAYHHGLKTTHGWGLVEGRGKRAFVPPDDPHHPRHAHDPPAA
jgi:hypothetical protein